MKIFISQPMAGLTNDEILTIRNIAIEEIKQVYSFYDRNNDLEIVSTFEVDEGENVPENVSRIWWLGRAIQMLDGCDTIFMCKGWEDSKGCRIERQVAIEYLISIRYQK